MTERLLAMIISRAGPNLGRVLARIIINGLRELAERTSTDVDDRVVEWIAEALEDRGILEDD